MTEEIETTEPDKESKPESMFRNWCIQFWVEHGTRITFGAIAELLALFLQFSLDMAEEAKVVHIGVMMLAFNKARGTGQPKKPGE